MLLTDQVMLLVLPLLVCVLPVARVETLLAAMDRLSAVFWDQPVAARESFVR
jgi:hypothetical protein